MNHPKPTEWIIFFALVLMAAVALAAAVMFGIGYAIWRVFS